MPLLNHFQPPLSDQRDWSAFHAGWAVAIRDDLNARLPERFFAEALTQAGTAIEIDVATLEQLGSSHAPGVNGGVATLPARTWSPPAPLATAPAVFTDDFEVRVFSTRSGPQLVAAIELASPRNKDRPAARPAFATKCASYLFQGISLVIVDVVTDRHADLCGELLDLLPHAPGELKDRARNLYAFAARPVRRADKDELDFWLEPLAIGAPLVRMPLWLTGDLYLPLDLEATYMAARRGARL
jgi:hypothetical protein